MEKNISIKAITGKLWHAFYKNYVPDPMMDTAPYEYHAERVEKAYQQKSGDAIRRYFAILLGDNIIGTIYLKHIDTTKMQAEFGIALVDDSVKGRGYGTQAIRLLMRHAFDTLGMKQILADTVLRNTRSRHVLEKVGFIYTHEDAVFRYYKMAADDLL